MHPVQRNQIEVCFVHQVYRSWHRSDFIQNIAVMVLPVRDKNKGRNATS